MRYTLIKEVTDCRNCPAYRHHTGQGENWNFCAHSGAPEGYGNIVNGGYEEYPGVPKWCPLLTPPTPSAVEQAALAVVQHARPPTKDNQEDGLMVPAKFGYELQMALVQAGLYGSESS